jgi:sulfur carrier protein
MRLSVNGRPTELDREMSIAELLQAKGVDGALVAVEHNLDWVRREDWAAVLLSDGDRVEIVRIMAGG